MLPVCLQNVACSIEGHRLRRKRFGGEFHKHLEFLERSYQWGQEELRSYQEEKLRELVDFAHRYVPYYRQLFKSIGLEPRNIDGIADLPEIPILEKETIRAQKESLMSTVHPRRDRIPGRTSGSTGTALSLCFTPEAVAFEYACVWRLWRRVGVMPGDSLATFSGRTVVPVRQTGPPFWRYNRPANQTLFSQHHAGSANLDCYVRELLRCERRYWQGYQSFMNLVAQAILEFGGGPLPDGPKAVFTSSETLLPSVRKVIERATGARVYDRYGLSELCASMSECEEGNLHVDMEVGIVEVDRHTESEHTLTGELICTGLHNHAMPLLRYRTGDVATMLKGPCPCGRSGQVFTQIDGRREDYVLTPNGAKVGRMDHIFKDALNVKESQILQEEADALIVKIVRRPGYSSKDEADLLTEFRTRLGGGMRIDFKYVDDIPRLPNGKFRAVVSRIADCAA